MRRAKKNLPVIVVLLALLLIIFVIWFYNRRIESMDRKTTPATIAIGKSYENGLYLVQAMQGKEQKPLKGIKL